MYTLFARKKVPGANKREAHEQPLSGGHGHGNAPELIAK
jgi:hypothetical protein